MLLQVMAVRDRAADVFGIPMFLSSIGASVRSFGDEVNRADPGNAMFKHPDDFDLYHLGVYNDANAKFEMNADGPRMVAVGKDCVK